MLLSHFSASSERLKLLKRQTEAVQARAEHPRSLDVIWWFCTVLEILITFLESFFEESLSERLSIISGLYIWFHVIVFLLTSLTSVIESAGLVQFAICFLSFVIGLQSSLCRSIFRSLWKFLLTASIKLLWRLNAIPTRNVVLKLS